MAKVLGFSLAMLFLPLATYYGTLSYFQGQAIKSAIVAVCVANGVLIAFVVVALREESPLDSAELHERKRT